MNTRAYRVIACVAALALTAACDDSPAQGAAKEQGAAQAQSGDRSAAAAAPGSAEPAPPSDLVTAARGASLVSASVDPARALALIDGDGDPASNWSTPTSRNPAPWTFVVELMAPAALESVGIGGAGERPGGVAGGSAGAVSVEGSAEGPDAGYRALAAFTAAAEGETVAPVSGEGKVRWLRYTVKAPINAEAGFVYLSELVAYGTLDPVAEEGRFDGTFQTARVNFVQLAQDGPLVTGCYVENSGLSTGTIEGAVVDGVALVNWTSDDGITGTALFTRTAEGELDGLRYRQGSRTAWGGPVAADDAPIACEEPDSGNAIAEALEDDGVARLYGIHFEYDSDVPKPSARAALEQLRDALAADDSLLVAIEGHTDADGADDYNADLSQRRAEAVVAWLVEQGIAADRLTPVGKGESEPVASNDTADGKALNRRVDVRKAA